MTADLRDLCSPEFPHSTSTLIQHSVENLEALIDAGVAQPA